MSALSVDPLPARLPAQPTVARLARALRALKENERTAEQIRGLVATIEPTGLVPVGAERGLLEDLDELVDRAHELIDQLSEDDSTRRRYTLAELEDLVRRPEWVAAGRALEQLQEIRRDLDDYVRSLTEERAAYFLPFQQFYDAIKRAETLGVEVAAEDRELATEVWNRLKASDTDLGAGRYDKLAVALEFAGSTMREHQLVSTAELDGRRAALEAKIADAESLRKRRGARAELFVITGAPVDGDVPITVLMRRPTYEGWQETNLYEDFTVLKMDQDLFRDIIEKVTDVALRGLRAARPPDETAAAPASSSAAPDMDPIPTASSLPALEPEDPAGVLGPGAQAPMTEAASGSVRRAKPVRMSVSPELLGALDTAHRLEMIGRRMYSLLIPDAMQRLIDEHPDFSLTITSNNPELPWELLHDGKQYLCLSRMLARMPTGQTFPRRVRDFTGTPGSQKRVLLISTGTADDLPGAVEEIEEIDQELRRHSTIVSITKLVGDEVTSSRLTDELSLGDYHLIHYAGHAGFDRRRPERSYLLLPNGERFRADRVQRLLEGHPIVFLNACESSRSGSQDDGGSTASTVAQSQGLATAFVYGGAPACVGSLWPVFDDSARTLARAFYSHLLGTSEPVGEALRCAREVCRTTSQDLVTWAAYALYGEPRYVLGAPPPA